MSVNNLLSVTEAARFLGVTGGRIRQLLIARELPGQKLNARAWAIRRRDVEAYRRAQERKRA